MTTIAKATTNGNGTRGFPSLGDLDPATLDALAATAAAQDASPGYENAFRFGFWRAAYARLHAEYMELGRQFVAAEAALAACRDLHDWIEPKPMTGPALARLVQSR